MTAAPPMPKRLEETAQLQAEIEVELERICTSDQFRSSKRSCEFLRYVVKATLDGRPDALKERSIGIDLLGRDSSYEPSADSTVRVRANDVRKRLGSYYSTIADAGALRIVLPPGSYVPQFVPIFPEPEPEAASETETRRSSVPRFLLAGLLLACACAGLLWKYARRDDPFQTFWSQILQGKKVVLLSMTDDVRDRLGSGLYPLVWISGRFGVQTVLTSGSLTGATTNAFAKARIANSLPDDLKNDKRLHWMLNAGNSPQLLTRAPNGAFMRSAVSHAALVTRLPESMPILYIQGTDQDSLRKVLEELTDREHFPREIVPAGGRPLQVLLTLDDAGHSATRVWEPQR